MRKRIQTSDRARELRQNQTPAEKVLWELLRDRRLTGIKFRRQSPISRYIADFCCRELRLIVEADGGVHSALAQEAHDANRDGYLRSLGYTVLRFSNREILETPQSVLDEIARTVHILRPNLYLPSTSPSPGEGGGEAGEGAGG